MTPPESLLLEGLRVVDLTRLLPGPLCTMLLGDYGAEVVKVEDTVAGDPTRAVGREIDGTGSFFWLLNRNKKSLAVNLKTSQGREILRRLALRSDVLVEGFRPGVMERLGSRLRHAEIPPSRPYLRFHHRLRAEGPLPGAGRPRP